MTYKNKHNILNLFIAAVWFVNGLFCKVLNLVPRHQEIVSRITGYENARSLTLFIGILEIAMAVWVASSLWSRFNAVTQIVIIATMNMLEFILVPDLLLWGRFNAVFAFVFIVMIYYNEFYLNKKVALQA